MQVSLENTQFSPNFAVLMLDSGGNRLLTLAVTCMVPARANSDFPDDILMAIITESVVGNGGRLCLYTLTWTARTRSCDWNAGCGLDGWDRGA